MSVPSGQNYPEFHWIMDVKTTADIQRFKTAYYDYRYHVQDAFYSDGYEAQFGVQPTFVFWLPAQLLNADVIRLKFS